MSAVIGKVGRRAVLASALAVAAVAGTMVSAIPAGAATASTSHNLMLMGTGGFDYVQIVSPGADTPNGCVQVITGKWVSANFLVTEGQEYSFQALRFDDPKAGPPCGGGGTYLGPSVDSPLTISHVSTQNYWETIRLG
ncbi:hypothetical protein BCF44_14117 [Kutzneria buriramensis]|uniref:Uncharacterized protein n=1 Tax=Kutzneria buriramensis TaxID=1045776 RepID=A0A3E0G6R6_9PSEU|nr:hypothetical protein BCF44_14117 [Kutzneria buriramensis]